MRNRMAGTLFADVMVLDCSGEDPYPGEVMVEGNRITAVRHGKGVVSGDTFVPHAPSTSTVMSESEVAAAAEVVHAHGRRMSAHARSADAVKLCVRYGVKVIYHANFVDDEALDLLEENRDWVFVSPNIGFTAIAAHQGQKWFTEQQVQDLGFREELEGAARGLQELKRRGVRILGGGDYGFGLTPHGDNARDLDHLHRYCGFSRMEALLSMTKNGGEAMGLPGELGQIREGFSWSNNCAQSHPRSAT